MTVDHVELFVPDRYEAARWYERVFGLTILPEYESWASDPRGPLMISGDGGGTKLALFEGPSASGGDGGFRRVAFRLDGARFVEILLRLGDLPVHDARGRPLTRNSFVDHQKAFSIYFSDPYGHPLEITTYDYEEVCAAVAGQ